MKVCIFCDTAIASKGSNEHIFPRWLLDYLRIREEDISPTHTNAQGQVLSTRRHKLENLVEGRVCLKCNNGWMSSLEGEIKPLLVSLMETEKEVVQLKPDERLKVARWAFKTAITLNSASNFHKNVPPSHFPYLYRVQDSLPPSVVVVAQQHHGDSPFYWLQMPFVLTSGQVGDVAIEKAKDLVAASYRIGLQLKKLLLLVAYWPWADWRYIFWRGIHVPLWPTRGPVCFYGNDPLEERFPWRDSLAALITFHMTLSVRHTDSIEASASSRIDEHVKVGIRNWEGL